VFLKNLAGENAATFPLFDEFFVRALWAPDSRAVLCSDGRLFSLSDGSAIKLEGLNIESIAFSPRGDVIGAGGRDGAAMFWDRSGKKLCSLSTGENTWISRLAFSPDGRCAATVQGKSVGLWELWVTPVRIFGESQGADVFKKKAASGGDLIEKLDATRQVSVHGIHVSPTANTIVAGVGPNGVLWDPGGERMHVLEGHSGVIWTTAFSPDGERIVTGSEDNSARIWNKDGIFQSALTHEAAVITAAFSRGSSMVATGSRDGNVRLWKAESGELIREIAGDGNAVAAVAFFDQRPALLVSTELEARIVNLDGDVLQKVDYGRGMDNAILSADDRTLTTRSWKDHLISRVDLQSGNVTTFKNAGWAVDQIAVSPDERIIAASDINGLIRFWDSAGGELRSIQRGFRAYSLAFSRDGNSVLVGLETGVIEMWPCPKTLHVFLDGGFANPLSDADRAAYNIPKHQGSTTSAAASGGI
jgi:WD40 repeat protein